MSEFLEMKDKCERLLAEMKASPDPAKRLLLLRAFRELLKKAEDHDESIREEGLSRARQLEDQD
jgi:hypothetical protein